MRAPAGLLVDTCAWTGHWGTWARRAEAAEVVASLTGIGADLVLLSPLDGVWAHDLHRANSSVYAAAARCPQVRPAPLLDPTLPSWPQELQRAVDSGAPLVRLLPAYADFDLSRADDCAAAIAAADRVLWVQTRLEDPRRQHPRAQVPDTPVAAVVDLARRRPDLAVVIGGSPWRPLLDLAGEVLKLPRLYADTAQVDGLDSLRRMADAGLGSRLLFATHAPFFVPLAGLARILCDLDEAEAAPILGGNACRLFGLGAAMARPRRPGASPDGPLHA